MQTKTDSQFYSAVDRLLDTNEKMSVCKDCCNDIFDSNYAGVKNLRTALINTCRILNVAFADSALAGVEKRIDITLQKSKEVKDIFGLYKQALAGSQNVKGTNLATLTFVEIERDSRKDADIGTPEGFDTEDEMKTLSELQDEWGLGWSKEEYGWFERQVSKWKKSHKADTMAEITLLKEIIFKQFEITKARKEEKPYNDLVKEMQSLIKSSGLSPKDSNAGSSGKSRETFGNIIKEIEENEPAEIFGEERDAFKDWQNIEQYFERYIVRPLKNFVTGSRDFSLTSDYDDENAPDIDTDDIQSYLSDEENE